MAIYHTCPKCGIRYTLDNESAGTVMTCPRCNTTHRIPAIRPLDPLPGSVRVKYDRLHRLVTQDYIVEACRRCREHLMELIEISPNAKTISYKCVYCEKTARAEAGTPNALESIELWDELVSWVAEYNRKSPAEPYLPAEPYTVSIQFETPEALLPFEQTTRSAIPQAVRSEVWRRDGGKCVDCGSKHNIEFDHIIPVSKGGATTARNLQLLCESCNLKKGAKV